MCFIVDSKPKIAKQDIECFKLLRLNLKPYLHCSKTPYKIGKLNEHINLIPVDYLLDVVINEGYHSYKTLRTLIVFDGKNYYDLGRCFKCIIPEGTEYYENFYNEYVSSNIIIKEEIK